MIRRATKQIDSNIREEFLGIRRDAARHTAPKVAVEHARELLAHHAPALVVGRAQVLLDSMLSDLMEDAIAALREAPTDVQNDFYALDLRGRLKRSFTLEPQTLQFSFDPRIMAGGLAGGGTLVAGGLIVGLVLSGLASRILAGLATLASAAVAFKLGHTTRTASARMAIESDLSAYIDHAESHVSEWLEGVAQAFVDGFDKFASPHAVRAEEP